MAQVEQRPFRLFAVAKPVAKACQACCFAFGVVWRHGAKPTKRPPIFVVALLSHVADVYLVVS